MSNGATIQTPPPGGVPEALARKSPGFARIVWRRLRADRFAMAGLIVIGFFFLVSWFAPVIANNRPIIMRWNERILFPAVAQMFPLRFVMKYPELTSVEFDAIKHDASVGLVMPPVKYSPIATSLDHRLLPPDHNHPLGTDELGRDVLARMVHGTTISLKVGLVAVGISLVIGLLVGALAGYYGGLADILLSRLIEIVICFPFLFLILAVIAFLPPNIYNVMIVIGITRWTDIARYTRAEFVRLKNREFTEAARALGASDGKIILRHILPNSLAPVLVTATFSIASAILIEAALSFLGLGTQPPTPSWGGLLASAREQDFAWWLTTYPGIAIFLSVTAYNLLGEGLRDASDPRAAIGVSLR
ncbi:MAG: ABC transporter permease [Candidatus Krumholzibacteria bacterium]|nr:ABC transporter permease [Candidatus Krumholzibacteria bacterium]MDH4337477.1 ABC transporter permease [Candidatus Krumholzibacteria bacterium]MDH5270143.1 ABC transporter permease [Candidatus Krumholzibacteria bacterium]